MIKMNIENVKIVKRTFEGKENPEANDNPVTSKYSPSKKYALVYDIEGYCHNPQVHCVRTKKDAEHILEMLKEFHNVE